MKVTDQKHDADKMFRMIKRYHTMGCVMGAGRFVALMTSRGDLSEVMRKDCHESIQSCISNLYAHASVPFWCVIGSGGKDETLTQGRSNKGGIVPGHAYTIVNVYTSFGHKLLKLRWFQGFPDMMYPKKSPLSFMVITTQPKRSEYRSTHTCTHTQQLD